jgi:hypothetical protein
MENRPLTLDSRIPDPLGDWGIRLGKFILCSSIGMLLWTVLFITLSNTSVVSAPNMSDFGPGMIAYTLALFVGPPVVAAVVHKHLPKETVDKYHRLGKSAALFVAVNITISAIVLAQHLYTSPLEGTMSGTIITGMVVWVGASLLLPGSYLGVLVAARWTRP